jgi:hypothetical protein
MNWQRKLEVFDGLIPICVKGFLAGHGEADTLDMLRKGRAFCVRKQGEAMAKATFDSAVDVEVDRMVKSFAARTVSATGVWVNEATGFEEDGLPRMAYIPPLDADDSTGFEGHPPAEYPAAEASSCWDVGPTVAQQLFADAQSTQPVARIITTESANIDSDDATGFE